jgi:hypothetical protein
MKNAPRAQHSGFVLVIVLVSIVIISILLIAYLSVMQLDRAGTENYTRGIKAQEIAFGAFVEILGDLTQEIDAGSLADGTPSNAVYTVNGTRIAIPATNAAAIPARIGFAAADYAGDLSPDKLLPTLIRVSRAADPFYTNPPSWYDTSKLPPNRASAVPTALSSANRRVFSPGQWNKPMLLGTSVPSVFSNTPPDWVYVTRSGSRVLAAGELAELKPTADLTQTKQVLGRYAYVIYDEGGLLDINVAGSPASATGSAEFKAKSYLSYAELTRLPGLSQELMDDLVTWRNKGGISAAGGDYTKAVMSYASIGFLRAQAEDSAFLSRQDLIAYLSRTAGATNALPYLGTFSRACLAPTWKPSKPAGSSIDYAADAEQPASANRDLANVRFDDDASITHYKDDASPASYRVVAGNPLLQTRFSLARLAWLAKANPDTGTGPSAPYDTAIRDCFGLRWGTAGAANGGNPCWIYEGSSAGSAFNGTIKTLDQVASDGREPNFFEVLKAAILSGSLGLGTGPCAFGNGMGTSFDYHANGTLATAGSGGFYSHSFDRADTIPSPARISDMQIIQIGANIIDQYDADSYPTAIYFRYRHSSGLIGAPYAASTERYGPVDLITGNENLPYLMAVMSSVCTTDGKPEGDHQPNGNGLAQWWQPELWNPHQKPNPASVSVSPPGRFQIRGFGQAYAAWTQTGGGSPNGKTVARDFEGDPSNPNNPRQIISFTDSASANSAFYDHPWLLTQNTIPPGGPTVTADASTPMMKANSAMVDYSKNPFVGFWAGTDPDYKPVNSSGNPVTVNVEAIASPAVSFCLGWMDASGGFHPYSYLTGIFGYSYGVVQAVNPAGSADPATQTANAEWHMALDPRSTRLASSVGWQGWRRVNKTLYQDTNPSNRLGNYYPWGIPSGPNFTWLPIPNSALSVVYWADFAMNKTSAGSSYRDPDGVTRPGDGVYGNPSTGDGMLLFTSNGSGSTAAGDNGNPQHGRRPVILNRPFRSVGELGYVFRDQPFKSLDFFSDVSADAALLDVFSLTDSARISDEKLQSVSAGWINPNSASVPVIEAILAGGSKKEADANYNLSASDAKTIAQNVAAQLNPSSAPAPLVNVADLVTQLGTPIRAGLSATADKANKAYFEAPVRALSDVTNIRTWNLLIDVVAQSGNISPAADSLDDFIVQGERRYWLHVAIDRYTGEIIDQQLEPVYE